MPSAQHPVVRPEDFQRIARMPAYKQMIAKKMRFVIAATIFFVIYYFALPISVGYFPEVMRKPVLGVINGAYLFALSQFFMAWILAWMYMRFALKFDRETDRILAEVAASPSSSAQKGAK
jgi:uncharacterized membrane protein (DUF485 family)